MFAASLRRSPNQQPGATKTAHISPSFNRAFLEMDAGNSLEAVHDPPRLATNSCLLARAIEGMRMAGMPEG